MVAPSLDILGGQAIQAQRLLIKLQQETALDVEFLPINPRLPAALRWLQDIKYVRTVVTSVSYIALLLTRIPRYDVIHIFSASYLSFVLAPTPAILISKLFRKKSLLNYRSGEAEDHLRRWKSAVATIRLVDKIVVPSGYLVDVFSRFGLAAHSIFNFVDTARFQYRRRSSLRPVFLSNRNLEPLYNVGCVLRAFALVQQRFPDASLTVAGDGSQRRELEALSKTLELRNVSFIGRVAPEQMPALYRDADIYLNSPNIDNMPGSIIEAFASGLPVVTTEAGGIPYIVRSGENGLLVRCNDHEAMARAAIHLLEDNSFAEQLTNEALDDCSQYAWSAVREQWIDLYYGVKQAC